MDERLNGLESRSESVAKMGERCVCAQGLCMVGAILFAIGFAGTCWQGIQGMKPLLSCLNDGLVALIWVAMLVLGARFFSASSKQGGPFRIGRAKELGVIAILAMCLSFVPGLITWLAGLAIAAFSSDPSLTEGAIAFGEVAQVEVLYVGFILLAFADIFRYGCLLQQEDDGLV